MEKIDGNILITGAAGFIGAALSLELIKNGGLFNFSVYTIGSVLIGILAVFIGFYLTNR